MPLKKKVAAAHSTAAPPRAHQLHVDGIREGREGGDGEQRARDDALRAQSSVNSEGQPRGRGLPRRVAQPNG